MVDPEIHTLHLLREMRDSIRALGTDLAEVKADVKNIKQIASGVMRMGAMMAETQGTWMDNFKERLGKLERDFMRHLTP